MSNILDSKDYNDPNSVLYRGDLLENSLGSTSAQSNSYITATGNEFLTISYVETEREKLTTDDNSPSTVGVDIVSYTQFIFKKTRIFNSDKTDTIIEEHFYEVYITYIKYNGDDGKKYKRTYYYKREFKEKNYRIVPNSISDSYRISNLIEIKDYEVPKDLNEAAKFARNFRMKNGGQSMVFARKRQWEKLENFTAFVKSKGWIDRVLSFPNLLKFLVVSLGGDGYGVVQYSFIYFYDSRRKNNVPDWLLSKVNS